MKIGAYLVRGPGSVEERLRAMKAAGFDFICLSKGLFDGTGVTPEICGRVGIEFDNVHLTGDDTTKMWTPGEEGEQICLRYLNEIKLASEYGVKVGITHVTWGTKMLPEGPNQIGFDRFLRIAECAAKCDFQVAIENSAFPGHVYYILDHITGHEFGHCYDTGHRNAFARDEDFLGKYGDRLIATHFHDNDARRDLHMMPLDGTIDWDKLTDELAKTKFARERITSEFGGAKVKSFPGMSKEDLEREFSCLAAYGTKYLGFADEQVSFYMDIPFDELLDRLYSRMKTVADMITAKSKGI